MPDDDFVPGRVRQPYRRAFRNALDGVSDRSVGDVVRRSLPRDLRESGGCVEIPPLARAARDLAVYGDEAVWAQRTADFLDANGHSAVARAILREAEAVVGTEPEALQGTSDEGVCTQLTEGGLRRHVREGLFARERDQLLERFGSYEAERAYEDSVIANAGIEEIAAALVRHPDGVGLRAPQSRIEKTPMPELLRTDLAPSEENQ